MSGASGRAAAILRGSAGAVPARGSRTRLPLAPSLPDICSAPPLPCRSARSPVLAADCRLPAAPREGPAWLPSVRLSTSRKAHREDDEQEHLRREPGLLHHL